MPTKYFVISEFDKTKIKFLDKWTTSTSVPANLGHLEKLRDLAVAFHACKDRLKNVKVASGELEDIHQANCKVIDIIRSGVGSGTYGSHKPSGGYRSHDDFGIPSSLHSDGQWRPKEDGVHFPITPTGGSVDKPAYLIGIQEHDPENP